MKEQLESVVLQMYRAGVRCSEAVREFQRAFILTVLRDQKGNQCKAAERLGMHRNTLRRTIRELETDTSISEASTSTSGGSNAANAATGDLSRSLSV
jgi:Fis family transcriptional regulator, factor for inversion stimulation protein